MSFKLVKSDAAGQAAKLAAGCSGPGAFPTEFRHDMPAQAENGTAERTAALSYFFRPTLPVNAELARILGEQVDDATQAARSGLMALDEQAHAVRACCRKLRACIELVRTNDKARWEPAKVALQEIAQSIPKRRESDRLVCTVDRLLLRFHAAESKPHALDTLRAGIALDFPALSHNERGSLASVVERLCELLREVAAVDHPSTDGAALAEGFVACYRRARRRFARADVEQTDEAFDVWRKAVRMHRLQVQLLRCLWPTMMNAWRKELKVLESLLEERAELHLLQEWLTRATVHEQIKSSIGCLIQRRQSDLKRSLLAQGQRLFSEKPKALRQRVTGWWSIVNEESTPHVWNTRRQ